MKYISPKQAAEKWGISQRRVLFLCNEGRIKGAVRHSRVWLIPETAKKPEDARVKSGRYIKTNNNTLTAAAEAAAATPIMQPEAKEYLFPMPEPPGNALLRPRLLEKIAPPGKKLTYIHADAGYGKTTLLSQFARGRGDVVWLSLEEKDCDVFSFLQHMENYIKDKIPQFDFHTTDYIPFYGRENFIPTVLSALLQAIGSRRMTIIIDDVHMINSDTATVFLSELVKRCPSNLTLIMASRYQLWSGLLRLKLEGGIAELTKMDLCFNREEAEELWGFFDETAYSATEGWALAIQSYLMAAGGGGELSLSRLRADMDLQRYLLDEIFKKLPSQIRHFLQATSWLPNLEAMMCDSLLGIKNSKKILEELIHRNIFTLRLSNSVYRYHTLFRSFLQQNDDGLGRETLRKAMACCYDSGDYEQAADYALLLDDAGFIHDCISAALGRPFAGGRYRSLKKYFDCLEAHSIQLSPRVRLARGMYLSSRGNFYEADRCLSYAMPQLKSEDQTIYLYAMTHKARVLRNRVSIEESSRCIDSVLPLLEEQPMQVWYTVMVEKIHNMTLSSRLSEALGLTLAMMEKCSACGDKRVKAWFERYLAVVYFYMGDFRNCLLAYEKSLSIPREEQDWLMRHSVGAYAARSYQMAGQEEKVLTLMEAELERLHQLGLHEELCINYLIYAEILNTVELQNICRGKTPDFSAFHRYLGLAEEHAAINRSNPGYTVFIKILRMCAGLLAEPEKTGGYKDIEEIMPLVEHTTPFFQTLAYGRIANALNILGQDAGRCMGYYKQCIKIGEEIGSFNYPMIACGEVAAIHLRAGNESSAEEYARRFMELSLQYGHRYYFRFQLLFSPVLKFAAERGITPEFTREMLSYGGYKIQRVYINTLGCFYIAPAHNREKPVKIRTQKARELLAYLLENRGGVTRERIYGDLWGESEANNVSSLFHTRRGEIRRAFQSLGAENPILHENGVYRLCMDEVVCDMDAFRQAAAAFRQESTPENAQKVVDLYCGRYLDNMEALWAESTRLRFEEDFIEAAEFLLDSYAKSSERAKTIELLRRCTGLSYSGHSERLHGKKLTE